MPKVTVWFRVEESETQESSGGSYTVRLNSVADIRKITDLGFEANRTYDDYPTKSRATVTIECDESDPRFATIVSIIGRHGISLSPRMQISFRVTNAFSVLRRRTYDAAEIAGAELLRLLPRYAGAGGLKNVIAEECYLKGGHDLPREEFRRRNYESLGNDDEGWRVRANKRLTKSLALGHLYSFDAVLLSAELKAKLEESGLAKVNFIPVRYDKPAKVARQLWQFGHRVKMPPCLTLRISEAGDDYKDDDVDGCGWEDGGYPAELTFRRKEVEAMGKFDMATTREKVGSHPGFFRSEVIVTHAFRKKLDEFGIKAVDYAPVRLTK